MINFGNITMTRVALPRIHENVKMKSLSCCDLSLRYKFNTSSRALRFVLIKKDFVDVG